LERAIDDLPEAFRTVFVICDIEEINTEQTARILSVREETAKTRLHRAPPDVAGSTRAMGN
jgi:RNA polymerase sigma-70 factor, ECF subfamily